MKKILSIVLAVILLVTALSLGGCGIFSINRPSEPDTETTKEEETTAPYELEVVRNEYSGEVDRFMKDLSGDKYDKTTVRIVTSKKKLVVPDENAGKVISDDLTERNSAVENTLGISLYTEEKDADTMLKEIKAAVRAGDYYADIIMYPQNMIGAFVKGGAVINMKSLPGFETDSGYFFPSAVASGTGGDAVYAVAGPASLDPDGLSCIYFNKDMIEKAGLESPYELVDRGEWTLDKYVEYLNAGATLEGDYYGYAAQNTSHYLVDLFYFGAGHKLINSVFGYYPQLNMSGDKVVPTVEKIRNATLNAESSGSALTAIETFKSGNTLFLIERLDTMKTLANIGTDWGILPMPKYDSAQKKYCTLAYYEEAMFFGVVSTATNYEMTADVIACLNIMSYGYTKDAYVTNASYNYLRDNKSIRMLSIVVENPVYDFAYSFASTYNAIPSATYMAVRNAVSGVAPVERYVNMWKRQFESSMYYLFEVEE
ncbi:MAG: hypothetical protein IJF69_01515 [Clostridia bacterium]|nr:hypothetical protein [Clostridia bacterium]